MNCENFDHGFYFFKFPIIHILLLLLNTFGFHYNIEDLSYMVIGKGNAGVTGAMPDKNEVSYILGMVFSPGFH